MITGLLTEFFVERFQQLVLNFHSVPAGAANQMVVLVPGGLVDQPPIADMRDQRQPLVRQKVERAVYGRLSEPRELAVGALVDFRR